METSDTSSSHPHLSVVPVEADASVNFAEISEQPFQLQQQTLNLKERELQLKERELQLKEIGIELRKKEVEVRQLEQRNEIEMKQLQQKSNIEMQRLQHGLAVDTFQRGTKALVSILGLVAGVFFHVSGDNLGYFLMGAGFTGFGITMANSAPISTKDEQ